jgi:hypothetical protein
MTSDVPSLPSSSSKITLDNSEPSRLIHPDRQILVATAASQPFAAAGGSYSVLQARSSQNGAAVHPRRAGWATT